MNDLAQAPRLYGRKGEPIVCVRRPAGHVVCRLSRDVYVGEATMDIFCDWEQPLPDPKLSINKTRCRCRAVFIRGNRRHGYQLHFAEGWR